MTSSVGAIGATGSATPTPVASAQPSDRSAELQAIASPLQNPRVIQDPAAGFITQYLSSNGGLVMSQTPSVITVAYLRQGLASDGTVRASV